MRLLLFCLILFPFSLFAQDPEGLAPVHQLDNPFSEQSIQDLLLADRPTLLFREGELDSFLIKVKQDPHLTQAAFGLLRNAKEILNKPLLTQGVAGRSMLAVSRESLRRNGLLGMAYFLTEDKRYLDRLGQELVTVGDFTDWNPEHFLDVAEMSLAVAIGLDWGGADLPEYITAPARSALLNKGLKPSLEAKSWWVNGINNWNQVCHTGTIAAALVLANEYPELATKALSRALRSMPQALRTYAPDGIYPEGSSYWAYGTGFSVITVEMLRTAFGHDFGLSRSPGFLESGIFHKANSAPSGNFYNFGDSEADAYRAGSEYLAWFAEETQDGLLYSRQEIPLEFTRRGFISRNAALSLTWMARLGDHPTKPLPTIFSGRGTNPLALVRDEEEPSFFLGAKGGRADMSHGNMDAGSFIFELDGVRWALDLGLQPYDPLEALGIDLWNTEQTSDRWTLISKNSFNHNTLTINDSLHRVEGFARLAYATEDSITFDLTELFGKDVSQVQRLFHKQSPRSFSVIDQISTNARTKKVSWRMLTQAQVTLTSDGALLRQAGKALRLRVIEPAGVQFSTVSLDPPPLSYDMRLPNLQRLELNIPENLIGKKLTVWVSFEEE